MALHRPLALSALAIAAALLLTGCLDTGFPGPSPSAGTHTNGASPQPSGEPSTPAPTDSATPGPGPSDAAATAVDLDCGALFPIADVYAIDPNVSLVPLTAAPSTWLAQETIAADGTVCQATHATTGATAFIGVSAPGAPALAEQRAAAGAGSPLGSTGVEAFGTAGQLQVFHDERRVTAECDPAFNPDSLRALLELAVANGA